MGGYPTNEKVWALSGSRGSDRWPCQSFVTASAMENVWLVLAAPLAEDQSV